MFGVAMCFFVPPFGFAVLFLLFLGFMMIVYVIITETLREIFCKPVPKTKRPRAANGRFLKISAPSPRHRRCGVGDAPSALNRHLGTPKQPQNLLPVADALLAMPSCAWTCGVFGCLSDDLSDQVAKPVREHRLEKVVVGRVNLLVLARQQAWRLG